MHILHKFPIRLVDLLVSERMRIEIYSDSFGPYIQLNEHWESPEADVRLYYDIEGQYILRRGTRKRIPQVIHTLGDIRKQMLLTPLEYVNFGWENILEDGFGEFTDEPLDYV